VSVSQATAKSKLRVVLPLIAALAMFAGSSAFAVSSAGAESSAGSGGISTGGGDATEEDAPAEAAKYVRLWDRVSRRDKRWARNTAECESGKDPDAIGGGGKYRGAFQFLKSTWRNAPKSPGGDPIDYTYRTQAVVAVALKREDGTGHWPNCG
jgi:Transglycosylase-like domain